MLGKVTWPPLAIALLAGMPSPAVGQAAYTLQPGDTVQVWMAQSQDLRRDVIVGPDGGISLPLAGHVLAEGRTLLELEQTLRERLRPLFRQADLTLMLRPGRDAVIYVVGEVTEPGAFPYRSNMTVLHAIAVAGGIYRAAILPADQDRSVIVARQVDDGKQRLRELSARILRLEAEIAGRSTILGDRHESQDPLLVQEQALMEARALTVATLEDAQRQAKQLNDRNMQALEEQVETVTRRIELARDRLKSVSNLIARGGAESSQRNRHEAEIAELEGRISALTTEMVATERAANAETARYQAARQERQTQLLTDLQAARRAYDEATERLSDSKRIMAIYGASASAAQDRSERTIGYVIIRMRDGIASELEAAETSTLQPGDLVRVRYAEHPQSTAATPNLAASASTAIGSASTSAMPETQ